MRPRWLPVALVIAAVYIAVGVGFAPLTRWTAPHHLEWRFASWLICAIAYAMQIGYELWQLRSSAVATASHCGIAAAIGGFGLAIAIAIGSSLAPKFILALVVFPLIVGIPAFVVAYPIAALFTLLRKSETPPPAP